MKKSLFTIVLVLLLISVPEIALRVAGFQPYKPIQKGNKIISSPGPMFTQDSVYGYTYSPGKFTITLNNSLSYSMNVDSTSRVRINPYNNFDLSLPNVVIFGCSFFGGMGVNDSDVVSAQLQLLLGQNYNVINYSIPGHGMTTQLRKLQELIAQGDIPEVAVFSLASFHLHRNPGAYSYLKSFNTIKEVPMKYIFSYYDDDKIEFGLKDVEEKYLPASEYSSLLNLLNPIIEKFEYSDEYKMKLQIDLIDSAINLSNQHDITPVLILISKDDISTEMAAQLSEKGYEFIITQVDHNTAEHNLSPHDGHPNAVAHRLYAEEIHEFLKNNNSIKNTLQVHEY